MYQTNELDAEELNSLSMLAKAAASLPLEEIPARHLFSNGFGAGRMIHYGPMGEDYMVLHRQLENGTVVSYGMCMGCGNHRFGRIIETGAAGGRDVFIYESGLRMFVPLDAREEDLDNFCSFVFSAMEMVDNYYAGFNV